MNLGDYYLPSEKVFFTAVHCDISIKYENMTKQATISMVIKFAS